MKQHGSPTSMLDKAISILNCYRYEGDPFRLTELAAQAGLPMTTAFRLCRELTRLGLLEREANLYRLGVALSELGSLATKRHESTEESGRPAEHQGRGPLGGPAPTEVSPVAEDR
ncbi:MULTISPECIES: helix-turn-helix domain-containing protein [Streptomyces albovinaceus subgroup]|uniref:helix-turn-helix domain-containing protein n=1 Tax=Streptomyces albovinaceus subgroup TaxID=1482558 RepID=UPI001F21CF11|nr:helix-turn-helix domain-containing protein [Streptomyces mediolani]